MADLPVFNRTASTPHSAPSQTRNRNTRSVSAADTPSSSGMLDSALAWLRKKSSSNADLDENDEIRYERVIAEQRERDRQQRLKQQTKQIKQAELIRKQWMYAFENFHEFRQSSSKLQQLCWQGMSLHLFVTLPSCLLATNVRFSCVYWSRYSYVCTHTSMDRDRRQQSEHHTRVICHTHRTST